MIYLSIIIPIRNEEKFIKETLTALSHQDYPKDRFEILVVDGRSKDNTRDIVKLFISEHPKINIRLLDNPGLLSSRARNVGIRAAKGQVIGIIDGHVYLPNRTLFINMERIRKEKNALCLARPAPLDVPGLEKGKPLWIALARKSWLGHSRNSFIYSNNEGFIDPVSSGFAYDRYLFDLVGYFDESFDAAEDVEFHFRLKKAGILAYTSPNFLIYSYPRQSFWDLCKQQKRYGEGRARFLKKYPDGFTKETLIPAGIFLSFLLSPLAFLYSKYLGVISITYLSVLLLYWLILLITGFTEAVNKKRFFPGILIALAIWITHLGLGLGFLKTIILPK